MKTLAENKSQWLKARLELLDEEKKLTKQRDSVSEMRRRLPWLRVEKDYVFVGSQGPLGFAELFKDCSQLVMYHFMFGPNWEVGCKSCSFWSDGYDGVVKHLNARDTHLVVVSRAPVDRLLAFRERMGWGFDWVSSEGSDFNFDFHVSFNDPSEPVYYNFGQTRFPSDEAPGLSVFVKDIEGEIYHTYSCYGRGLDPFNGAYQLLDVVPKGRDEAGLSHPMAWVKLHDEY